jgi:predicted N-acyltransferase
MGSAMTVAKRNAYSIAWISGIDQVPRTAWDALAGRLPSPFFEWDWLHLMEASGSAVPRTGWLPNHLTVWSGSELVAAAPLYVKGHSAGEFVFDHIWSDVAGRIGIDYYPKMVGMSPFTPMIGYRFLVAPGADENAVTERMLWEIDCFCRQYHLSGCSFNFVDPDWQHRIESLGYLGWEHLSFVWQNRDYRNFDDYLAAFKSNQRRNIKRERRAMARQGLIIRVLAGEEIPPSFLPRMYRFYQRTNDKFGPWGCRYLTPAFFERLYDTFRRHLVVVAAFENRNERRPVGMSMLVAKGENLYGRYWGSGGEINALHFNACYYSPIEWAIAHGIRRFDPGAGGAHKIRRGFEAVANVSLHRFRHPRLRRVMETHIGKINQLEREQITALNLELPFARRLSPKS